jgi:large subunit ribosomal protein L10
MALNREQKEAVVAEVAEIANKAYSAIAAEYSGITVEEITALRVKARDSQVYLRVIKNNLAKRAVVGTDFECMAEGFTGPLITAFSMEDPGSAARVINDFAKENSKMVVRMVSINGELLDASEISKLAKMPTYDEAISLLMAVMKAPVEKLARTMKEVPGKLVRTVAAIKEAKDAA